MVRLCDPMRLLGHSANCDRNCLGIKCPSSLTFGAQHLSCAEEELRRKLPEASLLAESEAKNFAEAR